MEGKDSSRTEESSMHDERPHGYTLADEELERVHEKSMSGDVLDPIALDDPTGTSVERVVLRVGITVVAILVAGILLAQVACKNIRLSMVTDLGEGITQESVGSALSSGILWGGEIVGFPADSEVNSFDAATGTLEVTMADDSSRSVEQLLSAFQGRAMTLAMSAFEDEAVRTVIVHVTGHISAEDGSFTGKASDPMGEAVTFTWTRSDADPTSFTMTMTGYDPVAAASASALGDEAQG